MAFIKKGLPVLVGLLLIGSTAFAQKNEQDTTKNVSKKEIKKFARAFVDMQNINMKFKREARKQIKKSGLSQQRYRQIVMSKKNPKTDTVSLTKEEQTKYQKLHGKLVTLSKKMQKQLKANIEKEGLSWQRFQQIAIQARQDQELRTKIQKMVLQESQSGSGSNQ